MAVLVYDSKKEYSMGILDGNQLLMIDYSEDCGRRYDINMLYKGDVGHYIDVFGDNIELKEESEELASNLKHYLNRDIPSIMLYDPEMEECVSIVDVLDSDIMDRVYDFASDVQKAFVELR